MSKFVLPWDEGLVKQVVDILVCTVLECNPIENKNKGEESNE